MSEFGPPVTEFGPPLKDLAPPAGTSGPIGWAPADAPERPTLGWQPADAPPTPPIPPQYRAPDSRTPQEPPRMPGPTTPRAPESGRPSTPSAKDESWWQSTSDGYPPTPPPSASVPPRSSSGSLWDDDELAKKLVVSRPAPTEPVEPEQPKRNVGLIAGGVAALVVLIAVVLVIVFATRDKGSDTANVPAGSTTPSAAAVSCPARTEGNVTYGNGPGDTSSGVKAILGFQYAFFHERSGAKAREFVAPDANFSPAEVIQHAIDAQIPVGTTYCLKIEEMSPDRYIVSFAEHRPDGKPIEHRQDVRVVNRDGKSLIWVIYE
ncbi:hypothetical protein [Nocardia transvalensis]|uniref:hypothetical protein n=1 Tax=Nocardia transvalensis TaxID=37333 RepID=UPI001894C18C|nr:hypothetical protein [Nocardia transvalensis]MBF6334013.1 hypothetical protein [Nocardia transvalensis]